MRNNLSIQPSTFRAETLSLTNDKIVLSVLASKEVASSSIAKHERVQVFPSKDQQSRAVRALINASVAGNTQRAYQQDLKDFLRWGGTVPCAPELLAAFIADRAVSLSSHTIARRVIGISHAHNAQDFADPARNDLVKSVLRGVRRKYGGPQRRVSPILKQDLLAMLPLMQGVKGLRDRALILLGFAILALVDWNIQGDKDANLAEAACQEAQGFSEGGHVRYSFSLVM